MLKKNPVHDTKRYLDARLAFLALASERGRWQAAADEEELDLSTWIRRALKAAPEEVEKPRRDDELATAAIELRVNGKAKAGWEALASESNLSLSKWVRAVLNQAAARKRRRPA